MAITHISDVTGSKNTTASSWSVSPPASIAAGDLLVYEFTKASGAPTAEVLVTGSQVWHWIWGDAGFPGWANLSAHHFVKSGEEGVAENFDVTNGWNGGALGGAAFRGITQWDPAMDMNGAANPATAINPGAGTYAMTFAARAHTLANADHLLIYCVAGEATYRSGSGTVSASVTADAGVTVINNTSITAVNTVFQCVAYEIHNGTSDFPSRTFTFNISGTGLCDLYVAGTRFYPESDEN